MKQNELIEKIAKKCNADEKLTQEILKTLISEITESLSKGVDVQLWGFGRFERRKYNERNCYNPMNGKIQKLKPSYAPVFKAGTKLRNEINK